MQSTADLGAVTAPSPGLIVHISSAERLYQIMHLCSLPQCLHPKKCYFQEIREDTGGDLGQAYAEGGGREERHLWACRGLGEEGGHGDIWGGSTVAEEMRGKKM